MKFVKHRAVTLHRRRAAEMARSEGNEEMQGLYSEAQTEDYIPPPVIDVGDTFFLRCGYLIVV
jgi:xeroderma pigmentosum group C-complementing protein